MADPAKQLGRQMKYPYTYTAKIAHFPYKFYWKNCWLLRYWVYSSVLCLPIFHAIGKFSNSPSNVATWEEKRRQEEASHHEEF